jgi:hypothetical protein
MNLQQFLNKYFIFIPNQDQHGYDMDRLPNLSESSLDYLKKNYNKSIDYKVYVAINTSGYVKYKIYNLTNYSDQIMDTDLNKHGIYIKKDYYDELNKNKCKVGKTELCEIMKKSDKSPLFLWATTNKPIHAYTPIYYKLFKDIRNLNINFAEIGIYKGYSIEGWINFFPNANIYGYEYSNEYIENCKQLCPSAILNNINVKSKESLEFDLINKSQFFDVILDDSTHEIDDQINIMNICSKFTKKYLIIEDINLAYTSKYFEDNMTKYVYNNFTYKFVYPYVDDMDDIYNNSKILILTRK